MIQFSKEKVLLLHSLNNIIRTRTTGRLFAPGFILFFGGRQPAGITNFCLTQKSAPVVSRIFEGVYGGSARQRLAVGPSPCKRR